MINNANGRFENTFTVNGMNPDEHVRVWTFVF